LSHAIYIPDGPGRFAPTELARGPWDPDAQHGGAPAALLAGVLERLPADGEAPMAVVRLTYELLRPVPLAPLEVATRVARPGRRVQLLEATLRADGEEVVRATALRIREQEVPVPEPPAVAGPPRGPETSRPTQPPAADTATMFAGTGIEIRFAAGRFRGPGPACAWFRLRVPVLAGEAVTPLQRLAAAADFGNGISAVVGWATHVFINPDLTVYVERLPEGEWVALDAETRLGPHGTGVSDAVLFDQRGRIGRAQQALYVAERVTSSETP
jgi:acyl-Coa thioesterase superfamily protein/acyl-CoA thioesterase superfamily protein